MCHQENQDFGVLPSCPQWPAGHHLALNWGNGMMSAPWPARALWLHWITQPLTSPPLPAGRTMERETLRPFASTDMMPYSDCQHDNTHTHLGENNMLKSKFTAYTFSSHWKCLEQSACQVLPCFSCPSPDRWDFCPCTTTSHVPPWPSGPTL